MCAGGPAVDVLCDVRASDRMVILHCARAVLLLLALTTPSADLCRDLARRLFATSFRRLAMSLAVVRHGGCRCCQGASIFYLWPSVRGEATLPLRAGCTGNRVRVAIDVLEAVSGCIVFSYNLLTSVALPISLPYINN